MGNKICLVSITASHYRKLIYKLIDEEYQCDFIFGIDKTSVKRFDTSLLRHSIDLPNKYILHSPFYYQPGLIHKTNSYDVIISDLGIFCLSSWWLLLLAKLRRQKVYLWDHGWYGREGTLKKWMKRLYFALASGAFIYGRYAYDLMEKNGFNTRKLHVIHNSLDYDTQLQLRRLTSSSNIYNHYFNNDNPVLCFIGRLTVVKQIEILINALALLKDNGHDFNLVIIGDGEMKHTLINLSQKLQVYDRIWFYGSSYDEQKNAELIYNADICVSPGNVGLTAIHSMMFGCPVITHNEFTMQMPEFEAVKQWKTGAFFRYRDANSLADTILMWYNKYDKERENIREACYEEIDSEWNPHNQMIILNNVLSAV